MLIAANVRILLQRRRESAALPVITDFPACSEVPGQRQSSLFRYFYPATLF